MAKQLCEMCGLKPATIYFTQTVNGQTTEKHLCPDCAKQMQIVNLEGFVNPAGIIASALSGAGGQVKSNRQLVCKCGTTAAELKRDLKFGCAECYTVFADLVNSFLGLGSVRHKGKKAVVTTNEYTKPITNVTNSASAETELEKLRRELRVAVETEDYDRASVLHKKIKSMEKKNG